MHLFTAPDDDSDEAESVPTYRYNRLVNENSDRANREGYRERKKDQDAIYHSLITNSQPITADR